MPAFEIQKYYNNAYPQVSEVINNLAEILSNELVVTINTSYDKYNKKYVTKALKLMGDNPEFTECTYTLDIDLNKLPVLLTNNIALVFNRSFTDFVEVNPYILYNECPSCHNPQVMVVDYENKYLDVRVGHRVSLTMS